MNQGFGLVLLELKRIIRVALESTILENRPVDLVQHIGVREKLRRFKVSVPISKQKFSALVA